ncbi:hypothetical protein V5O48_017838, partial [Marasmius crinis-equi]
MQWPSSLPHGTVLACCLLRATQRVWHGMLRSHFPKGRSGRVSSGSRDFGAIPNFSVSRVLARTLVLRNNPGGMTAKPVVANAQQEEPAEAREEGSWEERRG